MRNTIAILSTLFVLSALVSIVSCSKKQQPDTPTTRVQGRWKKAQYATDDNNNGRIDEQEKRTQQVNFTDIISLSPDATGYQAVNHDNFVDTAAFAWFVGGDSLFIDYAAHLSVHYHIEHVNSLSLQLLTTTSTGLAWYNYVKQ